jgi:hypothetical protein
MDGTVLSNLIHFIALKNMLKARRHFDSLFKRENAQFCSNINMRQGAKVKVVFLTANNIFYIYM